MRREPYYLMWDNQRIGRITSGGEVVFLDVNLHHPARKILGFDMLDANVLGGNRFKSFVLTRIPSKERSDIGELLTRMGLGTYDWRKIMVKTKLFSPSDPLWLAETKDEKLDGALRKVLKSIFVDIGTNEEEKIYSPDGVNIKKYVRNNEDYGILKKRLRRSSDDVECEVTAYYLAKLLGVSCCEVSFEFDLDNPDPHVFSKFEYEIGRDLFVHFNNYWEDKPFTASEILNANVPLSHSLSQMILFDFVTRQSDRHLRNFAVYYKGDSKEPKLYPLYDNGRSLFFDNGDSDRFDLEFISNDPQYYTPKFGKEDQIEAVKTVCGIYKPSMLLKFPSSKPEVYKIVESTQRDPNKFDLITNLVWNSLEYLKRFE